MTVHAKQRQQDLAAVQQTKEQSLNRLVKPKKMKATNPPRNRRQIRKLKLQPLTQENCSNQACISRGSSIFPLTRLQKSPQIEYQQHPQLDRNLEPVQDTNSSPNSEPMQQKDFKLLQLSPIEDSTHRRQEYFRLLSLAKKKATIPASSICATSPNTSSSRPPATSGLLQSRCNLERTRFLHASHNKLHKTAATSPGVLPSRYNTQHKKSPTDSTSSNK
ncbi:hypothetical protein Nepgr_008043 [Nepenthes gracilis]|uniref:Uncharacterized protein n=1 Tax=Nepenthes gracilis TaxID=150966 RepID=A0AAD3S837_NEPGR|nr:hypothetical protein Nepgr_008043 [Nepenthes gracilis]